MDRKEMKQRISTALLFCLCLLPASSAWAWSGYAFKVVDGDTIWAKRGTERVKIRLYGIDSPEKDQDYGLEAQQFAASRILGKTVEIEPLDVDGYGRTVALVSSSGTMLNRELVRAGYAWTYTHYCRRQPLCTEFSALEQTARQQRQGLWQADKPLPPWQWRQRARNRRK